VIELVFGTIEASLKQIKGGGKLPIGNFGVFTVAKRPARMGRNPRTGEAIKIKASKKLRFRPAKTLKTAAGIV
jgi:DNA-binding protein HU-beta